MEWQDRKGRERLKESSKFYDKNLGKMSCGPAIVSRKWESCMRVNFSWLSNRSTNGGGIRPEKDLERQSKNQNIPFPRPRTKMNYSILATAPPLKKVKCLFLSKMNSEDTAVDSESIHQTSSRLNSKSKNWRTKKAQTSKSIYANCLTLM